jgi:hypothetical protein
MFIKKENNKSNQCINLDLVTYIDKGTTKWIYFYFGKGNSIIWEYESKKERDEAFNLLMQNIKANEI